MEWIVVIGLGLALVASFVGVVGWCEARTALLRRVDVKSKPHHR